jgi:hypothetical protein
MRSPNLPPWLFLIGLLMLFVGLRPAHAQNPILRCIGADGRPVFTDQPCDSMHATSVSVPAKAVDVPDANPPAVTCAGDVAQLRHVVIDAFASHDANRLAGLMLWNGYGRNAVVADIRSLATLMHHPLLDLGPPPDQPAPSDTPFTDDTPVAARETPGQLVLHVAGSDADGSARELRFDIVHRAGCLWLRDAG